VLEIIDEVIANKIRTYNLEYRSKYACPTNSRWSH
jgi:hypothetical protein